jgi:hypothetical protein
MATVAATERQPGGSLATIASGLLCELRIERRRPPRAAATWKPLWQAPAASLLTQVNSYATAG